MRSFKQMIMSIIFTWILIKLNGYPSIFVNANNRKIYSFGNWLVISYNNKRITKSDPQIEM